MKILRNCSGTQSRDPHVTKHNGKYYWTYAFENKLYIVESATVEGFASAQSHLVWTPDNDKYAHEVWAPELHVIDDVCYVYVACDDGDNHNHRMYVLCNQSNNPLEKYTNVGQITDPTDKWAIDGTILNYGGARYILWSGWEGDQNVEQNIYIAKLASPTKIDGERVLISRPDTEWEKRGGEGVVGKLPFINEGPFAFSMGGKTFVAYSGAGSWCTDYCVAILELVGNNPMDANSWKKWDAPILSQNGQFVGMGHCSIIADEGLIFFHGWSADEKDIIWHTVHPIVAKIRFDGKQFVIE